MQFVSIGVGTTHARVWFRAEVVDRDDTRTRFHLRCALDRSSDRSLQAGGQVLLLARQGTDQRLFSAPMQVESTELGELDALVRLRRVGHWTPENERREQVRLRERRPAEHLRCWRNGAWQALAGDIVDLSSRGIGLELRGPVRVGERVALLLRVDDQPPVRLTIEMRHVHQDAEHGTWRGGGLFRNLSPADHERIVRHIFAELRPPVAH